MAPSRSENVIRFAPQKVKRLGTKFGSKRHFWGRMPCWLTDEINGIRREAEQARAGRNREWLTRLYALVSDINADEYLKDHFCGVAARFYELPRTRYGHSRFLIELVAPNAMSPRMRTKYAGVMERCRGILIPRMNLFTFIQKSGGLNKVLSEVPARSD